LAAKLELPRLELDAVRHQKDWEPLPDADFIRAVTSFVDQDGWVVDGNYFSEVTEAVVWPAADTVVWVDLPKWAVMRRVVSRTLKRLVVREELWNGNRERITDILSWDPHRSIVRWSWTRYDVVRERYGAAMTDPRWRHLTFVRLRSHSEISGFLGDDHPA
jgi:adenylate kinase family enzyme